MNCVRKTTLLVNLPHKTFYEGETALENIQLTVLVEVKFALLVNHQNQLADGRQH